MQLDAERDPARAAMEDELARHRDVYLPLVEMGHGVVAGGIADQPARSLAWFDLVRETRAAQQRRYDELRTPAGGVRDDGDVG